jgi:hypothetical protein
MKGKTKEWMENEVESELQVLGVRRWRYFYICGSMHHQSI